MDADLFGGALKKKASPGQSSANSTTPRRNTPRSNMTKSPSRIQVKTKYLKYILPEWPPCFIAEKKKIATDIKKESLSVATQDYEFRAVSSDHYIVHFLYAFCFFYQCSLRLLLLNLHV